MKGNLDAGNLQLESRMREICQSGSEGGAGSSILVPTPITLTHRNSSQFLGIRRPEGGERVSSISLKRSRRVGQIWPSDSNGANLSPQKAFVSEPEASSWRDRCPGFGFPSTDLGNIPERTSSRRHSAPTPFSQSSKFEKQARWIL